MRAGRLMGIGPWQLTRRAYAQDPQFWVNLAIIADNEERRAGVRE